MNFYAHLRLEETAIPDDYMETVKNGLWENYDFEAFYLSIQKTADGVCYECALLPFEDESTDMRALNALLETKELEANGYGWEEYIGNFIEENMPSIYAKLDFDSEADTCGIYIYNSLSDFKEMLAAVSRAVRELAQ